MKNVSIKVYEFKELPEDIQQKVIANHIKLLVETEPVDEVSKNSNFYKAYKKAEDMRTPWFFPSYVWDYCENQILKDVKQYEYLSNGEIYNDYICQKEINLIKK